MKVVSTEEIINHKILPFNIYSEFGEKLFAAGEVLTPGKLLQLRHMDVLYRDEEKVEEPIIEEPKNVVNFETKKEEITIESFDMKRSGISKNKLSVDDIDILSYKGPINKKAKIDPQTQIKIKAFYAKMLDIMNEKTPKEMLGMFANVRDKIVQDILSETNEVFFSSQLKLLGEYNKCHALNVAILSGVVAKKMDLPDHTIQDLVLAGLLHDIGKNHISPEILAKSNPTHQEQKLIQSHTKLGYMIIKNEMDLPEKIARVSLDHHEHNDGSGYPGGRSGESISLESQIVNVCNYFDNLTSNRTNLSIKNTKEALRIMLGLGTKRFAAKPLYTFVHMFSYNDTTNFEEMIL